METITLSKEVLKNIAKNTYYSDEQFISDAQKWVNAIKEGRMLCNIISVSSSGMSRQMKFVSFEPSTEQGGKGWFRQYNSMLQALGFRYNKAKYCISVSGCGMDMIFHTNYTIIHDFKRMGIITDAECQYLCQQTPTNI